jgi:predicted DNA-binding transcriptional regulator AlpA
METLKLSIDDVVAATGESRAIVYDAINAGHLDTFLVGRRRFARPAAVRAWIDFLESESKAGKPVNYRRRASAPIAA